MNTQSKDGHKLFFCYYCLPHFTSENILKNHTEVCLKINRALKVKMSQKDKKKQKKTKTNKQTNKTKQTKNNNIIFTNFHKQSMVRFVIYADFECITVLIKEEHRKQTVAYLEHITETSPYSFDNFRKLSLYNCFMPI